MGNALTPFPQEAEEPQTMGKRPNYWKIEQKKHSRCEPFLPTSVLKEEIGKKSCRIVFFGKVSFIPPGQQEKPAE